MVWRVVIADDHPMMREALVRYLANEPNYIAVGVADDGSSAISLCKAHKPDVALIDLRMPGMCGVDVVSELAEHCPDTKVVIVTAFEAIEDVIPVLRAGASGYILKHATPAEIIRGLNILLDGKSDYAFSPGVTSLLARYALQQEALASGGGGEPFPPADLAPLSSREHDVLELLSQGFSNKEIAHRLCLSSSSVKAYIGRLCIKLDARDRLQVVIRAFEYGLVAPRLTADSQV